MQPPEAWIVGVAGGELLQLPTHRPRFLPLPVPFHLPDGLVHPHVRPIRFTLVSHVVDGQEGLLDVLVHPVQVDIGEQGTENASLRRSTQRCVVAPFLQIPGLEQSIDQPQEAVVANVLGEDGTQTLRDPADRNTGRCLPR